MAGGPSRLPTPSPLSLFYCAEIRIAAKPSLNNYLCVSDSHLEEEGDRGTHLSQVDIERDRERKRERSRRGKS